MSASLHTRAPYAVIVAFVVAVLLLAAGCSSESTGTSDEPARTIEHELGTTDVAGKPQQVVALEYSFVDALHALGMDPVGIADDDAPERIEQLVGTELDYASVGTRLEPNIELIASLKPDLIIADTTRHAAIYEQLQKIAPTIVLNSWNGSYDDIKSAVVTIADALGDKAAGEQALTDHESRIDDLKAEIPADDNRRYLLAVASPENMTLHTSAAFTGSVFEALGLTPAIETSDASDATESGVGMERLIAVNPDVLFVAVDDETTTYDSWSQRESWQQIAAVRNDEVHLVDRNQYSRFRGLHNAEVIAQDIVDNIAGA